MRHIIDGRWDALRAMNLATRTRPDDLSFVRYARYQHISHYLLQRITNAERRDLFPAHWIEGLGGESARLAALSDRLVDTAAEVIPALHDAGVDTRLLKGRPFALLYYGDVDLRRHVDLDILVRAHDVNKALRTLWRLGFRTKPRRVDLVDTGPILHARSRRTEHAVSALRDGIHVDLHWRLRNAPAYRISEDELWAESIRVELDGAAYDVLDHEHALLLMLLSIAHDVGRCACRLKHLLDVHRWLRVRHDATDWAAFFDRRAAENTLSVCVNVLHLVLDVFDSRAEFAALDAALSAHEALRVARSSEESLALLHSRADRVDNAVWLAKVYPVSLWRDAAWMIERSVPHAGRIPVSLWRGLRFTWRLGGYAARRAARSMRNGARSSADHQ